jgi:two-component system, chemotaxis family, sensor kinase CheA
MEPAFSTGDFLDGFLEEAEEHLQAVNQLLLRLERDASGRASPEEGMDPLERIEVIKELFRSFHTLKGMSGMVGLKEAVRLSHAAETLLLAIQQGSMETSPALIDRLFLSTRLLAMVVETVRDSSRTMPDIEPELQRIEAQLRPNVEGSVDTVEEAAPERQSMRDGPVEVLLPQLAVYAGLLKSLGPLEQKKIGAAVKAGQHFNLAIFIPSAERAERGENVDQLRAQIIQAGALIKAVPDMDEGKVRFLFLFSSQQPIPPGAISADEVIPLVAQTGENFLADDKNLAVQQRARPQSGMQTALVRVELDRLDEMIRITGDLMQLRMRLMDQLGQLEQVPAPLRRELRQTTDQINRVLRDLRRSILRARMVPLSETFNQMPLVVRDLSRASQKEVRLVVRGENTEVDKLLVERLREPLIHLVRNAIIHGIETQADRVEAGKNRQGMLTLTGIPQGDHITVEVRDDGRGVNLSEVKAKAVRLGLLDADAFVDAETALRLISKPGFSTRRAADEGSGRGVGLDVVQRMVRSFGGHLSLETTPGQGSIFRLRLPLSLVIMEVLLVQVGQERYAIPRNGVLRVLEINPAEIVPMEGGELVPAGGDYYILHRLGQLVRCCGNHRPSPGKLFGLVPDIMDQPGGERRHIVVVDRVVELREVVVRTLSDPYLAIPGVAGATEQSDGRVVLILDLQVLLRAAETG